MDKILKELFEKIDQRALVEKIRINCINASDRNIVPLVTEYLEKRKYIKTTYGYIKDFVIVYFEENNLIIKHDIKNSKPYIITDSYLTELPSILDYFERL